MEDFRLFAVAGITTPPMELKRLKVEESVSYCGTLTLPLSPLLVVFSQGVWPKGEDDPTLDVYLDGNKIGIMLPDSQILTWDTKPINQRLDGEKVKLEIQCIGFNQQALAKKSSVKGKIVGGKKFAQKQEAKLDKTDKPSQKAPAQDRGQPEPFDQDKLQMDTEKDDIKAKRCQQDTNKVKKQEGKWIKKAGAQILQAKNDAKPEDEPRRTDDSNNLQEGRENMTVDVENHKPTPLSDSTMNAKADRNPSVTLKKGRKKKKRTSLSAVSETKKAGPGANKVKKTRQRQPNFEPAAPETKTQESGRDTQMYGADDTAAEEGDEARRGRSPEAQTIEMDVDDFGGAMQMLNESTPQVDENMSDSMHSPLPRKSSKNKRLRSKGLDSTPEDPTPKKPGLRMRAGAVKDATPKSARGKIVLGDSSFAKNMAAIPGEEEGGKLRRLSGGRVTTYVDLSARVPRPSGRWGHTMLVTGRDRATLIGGQGDKQQLSKDSVWTLHSDTRRWEPHDIHSEGQKPEYRMGHTATYDPVMRCVYIFGGSKNSRWFHDVHMFDLDESKWTQVKVNGKAPTRAYHTAILHRHELWIFGGVYPRPDPNPDGCSNDVHIFSPVMQSWYCPLVQGEKPLPRSGHSATLINDQMVMFGGWDAPFCYNDLFVLDITTVDWQKPDVKGTPPKPRSWHASCALSNRRILIHGGYDGDNALQDSYIFDLGGLSWSCLVVPSAPKPRAGHACICLPYSHENQEDDEVLVFGGGDNDGEFYHDLFSFSLPFQPVVKVE